MRKVIDMQKNIFGTNIDEVEIDIHSRDEIPKLLLGIQYIFKSSKIFEKVKTVLLTMIPDDITTKTGKPGMDLWKILVLGTLRLSCNWDYDKVHEIANNHRTVRQLLGIDTDDLKKIGLQTIKDNVMLFTPKILAEISNIVVDAGHYLLNNDQLIFLKAKCDSFVVETNVHYPTDINLLLDAVRKMIFMITGVCFGLGITTWRQHIHNYKSIKKLFNKARKLKRSNSNNDEKKANQDKIIVEAHQAYIDIVESFIEKAKVTMLEVRARSIGNIGIIAKLLLIEEYISHAERQIDQIRRRVINGEDIPHIEKVFSIFEEHTEWINKGKAGVPQELGLRVSVVEDQYGFILHHHVMKKETDDKIAVSIIEETKKRYEMLSSCSFDRGYYTPENKKKLKEILHEVILPKKGKLSVKDKEEEYSESFLAERHKHSAVESAINALENHGLDRCPDHGLHGFKRYVGLAVLARNLEKLGDIIQKKEIKKERIERNRLKAA